MRWSARKRQRQRETEQEKREAEQERETETERERGGERCNGNDAFNISSINRIEYFLYRGKEKL